MGRSRGRRLVGAGCLAVLSFAWAATGDVVYYIHPTSGDWETIADPYFGWRAPATSSLKTVPADGDAVNVLQSGTVGVANTIVNYNYSNYNAGLASLAIDSNNGISQTAPGTRMVVAGNEIIGIAGVGLYSQITGNHTIGGELHLGEQASGSGTYLLTGDATLTSGGTEYIGYTGSGTVTQSGGTNVVGTMFAADLVVGQGGAGTYTLNSGTITINQNLKVGANGGIGMFNQSGGSVTVTNQFSVGYGGNGGSYTLSGAGAIHGKDEFVGDNAISGTFTQTGGTNGLAGSLTLGNSVGVAGTYSLSAATGTSVLIVAHDEYIGYHGAGHFVQSGGTHDVGTNGIAYDLYVGYMGSASDYTMTGGLLTAHSRIYLGYDGPAGTFVQSSGIVNVDDKLYVGYAVAGGSYKLSGNGTLTVPQEIVNDNALSGAFIQTGGTNSATTALYVGYSAGTLGTYLLDATTGTAMLSAPGEYVGYNGRGTFTQAGGTNIVGATGLRVGSNAGSNGTYTLTGGSLTASSVDVGASGGTSATPATFNQSGGTAAVSGIFVVGDVSGGNGTLILSGGSLSVTGTMYVGQFAGSNGAVMLSGTGNIHAGFEQIGIYGSGSFTQTGGTNSVLSQIVISNHAGSTGSYTMNGANATLSVDTLLNNGDFHLQAGSASLRFMVGNGNTVIGGGSALATLLTNLIEQSSLTINDSGKLQIGPPGPNNGNSVNSLVINGNGVLELGTNMLDVRYTGASPAAMIRSYLIEGIQSHTGIWSGPTDSNHTLGYADSADGILHNLPANTILVKYTRLGDVNLDGVVGFADLLSLAQHYGQGNATWDEGDLNYDGVVNFSDLLALAQNYGATASNAAQVSVGAVPEPCLIAALALAGALWRRRARR